MRLNMRHKCRAVNGTIAAGLAACKTAKMPHMGELEYQRIRSRLDELYPGVSDAEASLRATEGRNRDLIRNIKRARAKRPGGENLEGLAGLLQWPVERLLSLEEEATRPLSASVPVPPGQLPYGGTVAAGEWLTVDEFNQDLGDHEVPIWVPRHPLYSQLQQIAWRVAGDSMDLAGIIDGEWIVGASYADYVDKIGELDNGNYVVVERSRYGGSERELTVKEVQFARRGMRLIPRSSNAKHKEFFIDLDEEADPDVETVRILGVVLSVVRDMAPRSRGAR